jgi:hypothetical protein
MVHEPVVWIEQSKWVTGKGIDVLADAKPAALT